MKHFFGAILTLGLIGCSSGNCRSQAENKNQNLPVDAAVVAKTTLTTDRVRVYKYDGSKQCGQGKAIKVDDMQKDLGDIKVFSSASKMDGLMHMSVCGSATGQANVYEINKVDLPKAKKAGFKEWTFE